MGVLLVDDSRVIRRLQRQIVDAVCDAPIHEASDGISALQRLHECSFQIDLILTDWSMPRMDGLGLVSVLKGHPQLAKIPVLMVTSHSEESNMRKALEAGVNGYLMKPFTESMLRQALQTLEPSLDLLEENIEQEAAKEGTLLRQLLEITQDELLSQADILEYRKGQAVLESGSQVKDLFLILDGRVEIDGGGSDDCFEQGDGVALVELMSRDRLPSALIASESSRLARVHGNYFEKLLHNSAELSVQITRYIAERARGTQVGESKNSDEEGLAGSLDVLELPDLLQALNLRQSSGTLELPEVKGTIDIIIGEVISVEMGRLRGEEAFRELIKAEPSSFKFHQGMPDVERNIQLSTTKLLMDTMRALDEATVVQS
jgi:two-component system chemotaxis response regulator CheY